MANHTISNRGLLPLGLIVSLSVTLTGFEFMSADIKNEKQITSKLDGLQDEVIYDDFEVEKPEMPKPDVPEEKPRSQPVATPPVNPVGPIVVSPIAPIDPGIVFVDPIDPLPVGWGEQKPMESGIPVDPFSLEEFPTYEEFKSIKDVNDRRSKTDITLINNVQSKATFPEIPRQLGIQGTVYVSFIVDKDGNIKDVKIVKGIHEALDEEAIAAVKKLPRMIPGKQFDRPVKVRYTIPVKFVLK